MEENPGNHAAIVSRGFSSLLKDSPGMRYHVPLTFRCSSFSSNSSSSSNNNNSVISCSSNSSCSIINFSNSSNISNNRTLAPTCLLSSLRLKMPCRLFKCRCPAPSKASICFLSRVFRWGTTRRVDKVALRPLQSILRLLLPTFLSLTLLPSSWILTHPTTFLSPVQKMMNGSRPSIASSANTVLKCLWPLRLMLPLLAWESAAPSLWTKLVSGAPTALQSG
mmetsp:Transcript_23300/g.36454  ORF Transcript_23300/g.36454 Transcript_23300/m.36454 type:complete len:222 (-) Transcript_23300:1061-1726(-)